MGMCPFAGTDQCLCLVGDFESRRTPSLREGRLSSRCCREWRGDVCKTLLSDAKKAFRRLWKAAKTGDEFERGFRFRCVRCNR